MKFGHEKLDVYQMAIEYAGWVISVSRSVFGNQRFLRDQWLRASQSIPLNIAEGNGKLVGPDRRRFLEIARGSVYECAAIQDILKISGGLDEVVHIEQKANLNRIAAMLTRLSGRGYRTESEIEKQS